MIEQLIEGVQRFQDQVQPAHQNRFSRLATGQSPEVMFIACSDSRVDPSLLTQSMPGDLFVARNAGNIVPHADTQNLYPDSVVGAVEFAVTGLKVQHIVVCGHSDCGAMKAVMNPASATAMPNVKSWVEHAANAVQSGNDTLDDVVVQNVHLQIEHLMTYRFVIDAVQANRLQLHGWSYDIGTGHVHLLT